MHNRVRTVLSANLSTRPKIVSGFHFAVDFRKNLIAIQSLVSLLPECCSQLSLILFNVAVATRNMSHHIHQDILGGVPTMSQYAGSSARADGLPDVAPPVISEMSRSAML